MPRIRSIKHEFFLDDKLACQSAPARLLFIGLWTLGDREGRLEDNPKRIMAQIFPYEEFDMEQMLEELSCGFITRYEVKGKKYIQINNFLKHQRPNNKEPACTIPAMPRKPALKALSTLKQVKAYKGKGMVVGNGEREGERKGKGMDIAPLAQKSGTPTQQIVEAYKVAKGIDQKDKGWDKQNFGRYSKAAKGLLSCFENDIPRAAAYLFTQGVEFEEKGISWTLETIARHAWDNKGKFMETDDEHKHSEVGADRILEQRGRKQIASAGELAQSAIKAIGARTLESGEYGELDGLRDGVES